MGSHGIKDQVAIVGMGCTAFGEHWNSSTDDLLVESATAAAASAGIGLQETGAGLNSANIASQSNQAVMNANEQGKASTMSMLGSLAGAAGTAASGGFAAGGAFA